MRKILENLNKLSLPATILIASIVLGGSYFATQVSKQLSIKKQQQTELQAKQEKDDASALQTEQQNNCITDAYAELQTLQDNLDRVYLYACSVSLRSAGCNAAWVDETKKEWLRRYEEEWMPQCKLGNRVFIHTEPYYPSEEL